MRRPCKPMKFPAKPAGIFLLPLPSTVTRRRLLPFDTLSNNFITLQHCFRMKKILPIIGISVFLFFSCQKNSNDLNGISGSWKLIEVFDKNTSAMSHRPPGSDLDVVITFLNSNSFAGHTLRNTITDGSYNQTGTGILFGSFSMTKIAEDEWGGNFLTVLHSCVLQSQMPCAPSTLQIHGNIMKITTSLRYDITLQRI
jgi:hypothetical protein